jgi:hypothetical protein
MSKLSITVLLILLLAGSRAATADLATRVEVNQLGTTFIYTVFNEEPLGSPNFVNLFHLNVAAPITVTGTPPGWEFSTDNATFIGWFNADTETPYPDDIAPQESVTFSIETNVTTTELLRYTVSSWDHPADAPGPAFRDRILAPSIQAVPEPAAFLFFGVVVVFGLLGWKLCGQKQRLMPSDHVRVGNL